MGKIAKIFGKLFFVFNMFLAFMLLFASLISLSSSKIWTPFAILSIAVPVIFLINVLFLVYWLLKRKKKMWVSLVALIVGFFTFGSFYKLGSGEVMDSGEELRVMTFNVWRWNKNGWIKKPNIGDSIIGLINKEKPDVLCIQEHTRVWRKKLGRYPYRTETPYSVEGRATQAIFSVFPIVGSGSLDLPGTANNIIYADIERHQDTIRVYNVHLQSFSIVPSSDAFSEEKSERNYKRLVSTVGKQLDQVKFFNEHKVKSPYKSLVCGDFNNTQFSNVYRTIKGDMSDTFLERGSGFGRTYNLLGFPLRIDYILADSSFEVLSHKNFDEKLSDHYPVVATLRLQENH
ncbi:endonuclease/exonuclease/phosphatase family protein [Flagellimonas sp.]|uniref:endonuclease/exonuclease/phosphatase family protein n=1 Tax=Flagellimonas sp. TaxID=2058762 RepID=UPI003B52C41F